MGEGRQGDRSAGGLVRGGAACGATAVSRWSACLALVAACAGCGGVPYEFHGPDAPRYVAPAAKPGSRPQVALVLGSGGRRGFAHAGVLTVLEAAGIRPDLVVGVSIGSLVGALHASGLSAAQIESLAVTVNLLKLADASPMTLGYIRGRALQDFVNEQVGGRLIEHLPVRFAAVATRQSDGVAQVFNAGNTGVAVQASSAVPDRFLAVKIDGVVYIDGDVASPVPVRVARQLGADIVIAVDISAHPEQTPPDVPANWIARDSERRRLIDAEIAGADVAIHPDLGYYAGTSAEYRRRVIAIAAEATRDALPRIRAALAARSVAAATAAPAAPAPPPPAPR